MNLTQKTLRQYSTKKTVGHTVFSINTAHLPGQTILWTINKSRQVKGDQVIQNMFLMVMKFESNNRCMASALTLRNYMTHS